ncbi:MAG TPA: nickel-type superoxide dismutase maturation protease [Acidimicrobiales bacterium]
MLLRPVMGSPSAHYRLVTAALTVAGGAWLVGRLRRVEVEGDSMLPTLLPGDRLVVVRGRRARTGDLVTVPDPRSPTREVVKRVVSVDRGGVIVRGDNPRASTDSRTFGPVPAGSIRGRVVYRYFPDGRRGRPQKAGYSAGDVV